MNKLQIFLFMLVISASSISAQSFNNWRGPVRDGHYPDKGLLKQWPESGPEMLWVYENLGIGFSSPVVANGKIYVTGMEGDMGYIYILSSKGVLENKFPYGKEDTGNYPGARSTPTIAGNLMYMAASQGEFVCMDLNTGSKKWSVNLFNDLDGINIRWGFTENIVIDGDMVFISPGGKKHNIVALNRHTGAIIWANDEKDGLSAYCSPLIINHNGRKMLITMMARDVVALETTTGKLIWSYPYANQRNIHPNTPVYHQGDLFVFSGYGMGGYKLRISSDGNSVTQVWENKLLDNQLGGVVLIDGFIYGAGDRNRRWFGVSWETGDVVSESREIDKGTVIAADGMMYAYTERGELALLKPDKGRFEITGKTNITHGKNQHWAHLVINNGILYVRHGNAIMAYNIRN
jgi:outer membrane protein assembly factor BamB